MENKDVGYKIKKYPFETKRYCQMLDLKDDPTLIAEYVKRHSLEEHWPIVNEGIRSIGILEMELYVAENRLFMIVETELDFDWEGAFNKLAALPKQEEWEEYMSLFQKAEKGASSSQKWQLMDRFFQLYEQKKVKR